MTAPWQSLAAVPASLPLHEAGPLVCAGVTVYNSLRAQRIQHGNWVAVQGIGGLGHLAIQFASKMGYGVIALSSGDDKKEWCLSHGANVYINVSTESDVVGAIMKATDGQGVSAILATGSSAAATSKLVGALGVNGVLLTLGVGADSLNVHPAALIHNNRIVRGWGSGSPQDNEETLEFAAKFGIHPVIQKYELKDAQKAYDDMNNNKLRYRAVIVSPKAPEK